VDPEGEIACSSDVTTITDTLVLRKRKWRTGASFFASREHVRCEGGKDPSGESNSLESHDHRTISRPDAMEYHRHRVVGCSDGGGRTVLASHVCEETLYSRAGGYASDIVDLFLLVPILLISGIQGYLGSIPARLLWLGAQGYLLYNLVIYAFGVHFNALLVHCATLVLERLRGLFLAFQDFSTIDNDVILIGGVINPYGAEGEMAKPHLNLTKGRKKIDLTRISGA